ncbi:MAG: hypothetical protein JNN30_20140 [Rhodanobacteraceae bacterium]|nr:hypothetical protein [Rhodanobacteraceae bacterium]
MATTIVISSSAVATTTNESDVAQIDDLLHGKEDRGYADADYVGAPASVKRAEKRMEDRAEHPFPLVKCVFNYVKTHFRGLARNTVQIVTLFALANLYAARVHVHSPEALVPRRT